MQPVLRVSALATKRPASSPEYRSWPCEYFRGQATLYSNMAEVMRDVRSVHDRINRNAHDALGAAKTNFERAAIVRLSRRRPASGRQWRQMLGAHYTYFKSNYGSDLIALTGRLGDLGKIALVPATIPTTLGIQKPIDNIGRTRTSTTKGAARTNGDASKPLSGTTELTRRNKLPRRSTGERVASDIRFRANDAGALTGTGHVVARLSGRVVWRWITWRRCRDSGGLSGLGGGNPLSALSSGAGGLPGRYGASGLSGVPGSSVPAAGAVIRRRRAGCGCGFRCRPVLFRP